MSRLLLLAVLIGCSRPDGEGVLIVNTGLPFDDRLSSDRALQLGTARFVWSYFAGGRLITPSSMSALRPTLHPGLADRIEVGGGGRVFTVHLSPEARFASGTPVRAADVIASISPVVPPFIPEGFVVATAVDDRTVTLRIERPQASFLLHLGWLRVGRADQMPRPGQPWHLPLTEIDAAGPFRVVAARDGEVVLAANPTARPRPRLAGVVLRTSPSWEALSQLLEGSVDFIVSSPLTVGSAHVAALPHLKLLDDEDWVVGLVLNCADARLADRRVRRALNLAVDRRASIERHMQGAAAPSGGYREGDEGRYAPAEAARLLDEAGWAVGESGVREKDGRRLEIEVLTPQPLGTGTYSLPGLLRGDLAEIGVGLRAVPTTHGELKTRGLEGRFEAIAWWHNLGLVALDYYRDPGKGFLGWADYGRCRDAAMEEAMIAADTAEDEGARAAAALRFYGAASEVYPMLFVYRPRPRQLIHRRLEGAPPGTPLYGSLPLFRVPRELRLPRDDLRQFLP